MTAYDQQPRPFYCSLFFFAIVAFYPLYVYLNAHNSNHADSVLVFLFLLALPRIFLDSSFRPPSLPLVLLIWSYGALALASIWFPASEYVDAKWLLKAFPRLIMAAVIVFSLGRDQEKEIPVVRWLLTAACVWLSLSIILCEYGVIQKDLYRGLIFWPMGLFKSNAKYYSFWLLFCLWAAIALLWQKGTVHRLLAGLCYALAAWALFLSTSESSQIGLVAGTVVFGLARIRFQRFRYGVYLFVFLLIVLVPLIWIFFTPLRPEDTGSILYRDWGIGSRLYLYDYCASLVRKDIAIGYGFGSTLHIPVPDGSLPGWSILPGGHPHNIVFLLFIEHGLFGFLWCLGVLLIWFDYLYQKTESSAAGQAIWALAVAGHVVYSLSFSIWHPDVVLSYCMFFVVLLTVTNQGEPYVRTRFRDSVEKAVLFITIAGIIAVIVDNVLLKGH